MEIRELTRDNLQSCAELITIAYNGRPWNYQWTPGKALKYLTELFDSSRFAGFCIYNNNEIVACMFAHLKTWWINDLLMIDELFVSPDHQGKGYGQALMDYAQEFCLKNGINSINLTTHKYMPSVSFYEKNKFYLAEQYVLMFKEIGQPGSAVED